MEIVTQKIINGHKNAVVIVKGWAEEDNASPVPLLSVEDLEIDGRKPVGLKIESLIWMIEEKMGMRLWWEPAVSAANFIVSMESRNSLRLDHGFLSPKVPDWSGAIYASGFKVTGRMHFTLVLDLDKQS